MNEVMRVLLVGGNEATREELSQVLGSEDGITVFNNVKSSEEALVKAKKISPDVIIMLTDVSMPGINVIDTTRAIGEAQIPARTIIITENIPRYLVPAIKVGATGLLPKSISPDELISAVRKICTWSIGPFSSQ